MAQSTVKELEWFDLETRLREVIYQQLEIFNKKAREDREAHAILVTHANNIDKRVVMLENCMFGENSGNSVLNELKKQVSDIEGSRKRDMVRFDQDVVNFKEKFKAVSFQITGNSENIKRTESLQEELTKDIQKVKDLVETHQSLILQQIQQINSHFKELNTNYLDKGLKVEEKMTVIQTKMDEILLNLLKYDRQFESVKKGLSEIYSNLNFMKSTKLDMEVFESERVKVESKLQELFKDSQDLKSGNVIRDAFLDKFIPLQTVGIVSDTIHSCADPFTRRRLAEYENGILKDLHNEALQVGSNLTREGAISKILESIKHVEQRKTEILIERPKEVAPVVVRTAEAKSPAKPVKEAKFNENFVSKNDMLEIFEKYCETKIEPLLQKVKSDIADKHNALRKLISSCENEGLLYSQEVLREVEELRAKEGRDMRQIENLFTELKEAETELGKKLKKNEDSLSRCCFMVVTLVENARIDLALIEQDEEFKAGSVFKPAAEPSLKRGVALNGSNILMPLRPSLPKVSRLLYREKEYQRIELVNLKEKMLRISWESVENTIPWKQEDLENLICDSIKLLQASGQDSEFIPSQNSKESLPSVSRTKTPNYTRKFKIV